ncbi:MAG: hypothetical protein ACLRPW_04120 [Intestinibacter sp.]
MEKLFEIFKSLKKYQREKVDKLLQSKDIKLNIESEVVKLYLNAGRRRK